MEARAHRAGRQSRPAPHRARRAANLLVDATRPEWMPVGTTTTDAPGGGGEGWYGRRRRRGRGARARREPGESPSRGFAARLASADACPTPPPRRPSASAARPRRAGRRARGRTRGVPARDGRGVARTRDGGGERGEGGGAAGEEAADAEADEAEAGEAGNEAEAAEAATRRRRRRRRRRARRGPGRQRRTGRRVSHHLRRVRARTPPPVVSRAPPPPPPAPAPSAGAAARGARTAPPLVAAAPPRAGGAAISLLPGARRVGAREGSAERRERERGGGARGPTLGGGDPELGRGEALRRGRRGGPVETNRFQRTTPSRRASRRRVGRAAPLLTGAPPRAHASRPPASLPAHELFCVSERLDPRRPVGACRPRRAWRSSRRSRRRGRGFCARAVSATAGRARARRTRARRIVGPCRSRRTPRTCTSGSGGSASCTRGRGGGGRAEAGRGKRARGREARGEGRATKKAEKTRGEAEAGTGTGAKGTFGLVKNRLWELQARFTRAVAELEFLGVARPVAAEGRVHAAHGVPPGPAPGGAVIEAERGARRGARRDETFLKMSRRNTKHARDRAPRRAMVRERETVRGRSPKRFSRRRAERAPRLALRAAFVGPGPRQPPAAAGGEGNAIFFHF